MRQWELRGVVGQTDEEREQGERLYATGAVMDQIPGLVWTTDPELRITSIQGSSLRHLGMWPNQLVGALLKDVLGADRFGSNEAPRALALHREALSGVEQACPFPMAGRILEGRVGPLMDAAGEVLGVIGVAVERELEQSESVLVSLPDVAANGPVASSR
jgi:PAS domain-containing protein